MPITMPNNVEYGLSSLFVAPINDDGTYGEIFEVDLPTSFNLDRASSFQDFFARNEKVATIESDQGFSGSMSALYFPDEFKTKVLGYEETELGDILAGGGGSSRYCALGWQFEGDSYGRRCWAYKVRCGNLRRTHQTTDTGIAAATETLDISATKRVMEDGSVCAVSYIPDTAETHEAYESYFDAVPHSGGANCKLAALTVGTKALVPAFSPSVTEYTVATTASSDVVTAAAADSGATITIKNGSASVSNGAAASWSAGPNTLTITVENGNASKEYTVTVTKS